MSLLLFLVVLVLGAAFWQELATRSERRRYPAPGRRIDIGGYRLHAFSLGEGAPTVVLDSALAGTSLSWAEIQPRIATFTRVTSYDRAGFGWSDRGSRPREVTAMAEELSALLETSEEKPPYVFVGHSYGGWVARRLAFTHPERVAGMVLVDVPHPREWTELTEEQVARVRRGARLARVGSVAARVGLMRFYLRWARPRTASGEPHRVVSLLSKVPPHLRKTLRSFWVRPHTLEALSSQITHASESARVVAASSTDFGEKPLVVLTAADPSPERIRDQDEIVATSKRGRHVIAKTSGHWIPLDEPELVVDAVRTIVEDVRQRRSVNKSPQPERSAN